MLRLALLGTEILMIELVRQDPAVALAELIAKLQTPEEPEEDKPSQFGVSGCHIERSSETDNWGEGEHGRLGFQ